MHPEPGGGLKDEATACADRLFIRPTTRGRSEGMASRKGAIWAFTDPRGVKK